MDKHAKTHLSTTRKQTDYAKRTFDIQFETIIATSARVSVCREWKSKQREIALLKRDEFLYCSLFFNERAQTKKSVTEREF